MDAIRIRLREIKNDLALVEVTTHGPAPAVNELKIGLAPAGFQVVLSETQLLEGGHWELLHVTGVDQRPLTRARVGQIVSHMLATLEPRLRTRSDGTRPRTQSRGVKRAIPRPDYLTQS